MTKAMDFDTAHMTMTTKTSTQGQSANVSAEGDVQAKPTAEHMNMKIGGPTNISAEVIFIDNTMYMKGLMGSSKWVKLSLDQLAQASGNSALTSMTNPLEMVKKVSQSVKTATYQGKEKVDGDDTDHYTLTVDTSALSSALGSSAAGAASGMPKTVNEDLWVDGDNHLRKTEVKLGSMGTFDVTMSNYGEKVDIEAPPAAQVQQMPGLTG